MKYDYIIVGQGISGSMLAWFFLEQGKKILVIDKHRPNSASNIASGVVNPITGRKMVKSWMIDELFPFAKDTYKKIETKFNTSFFFEQSIHKIFTSNDDKQLWFKKKQDEEYQNYLGEISPSDEPEVSAPFGIGEIKQTCWMDVPEFIKTFRKFLIEKNILMDAELNYDELDIADAISYKTACADAIFFCEGYKAINNPFFNFIPFTLAKGEQLLIHAENLNTQKIWNKNIFIIPKGNNNYSVGSTFLWDDLSETVTKEGRNELTDKIDKIISCEYKITEEKAGIRPTVKDRRPVIGRHKSYKNIYIFNGMGTKGISLAPYFAAHLVDVVLNKKSLLDEISVSRFAV